MARRDWAVLRCSCIEFYQFSILDLRFWIASPAFSGFPVTPFVALLRRIDITPPAASPSLVV